MASRTGWIFSLLASAAGLALWLAPPGVSGAQAPAIPAFPGAEGFGSQTPGGRGGRVIEVTNLNPEGPGSLRAAVEASGPRIVVFRVGGLIDLSGGLTIKDPFITLAGQTAPGDGVCLANGRLRIETHDVVLRYLRVRVGDAPAGGDPENRDCLAISGQGDQVYNVIADHCSLSWGLDENVETWYGPRNVTIQWCITSESLYDSLHPKGPHGMGMILGSQSNTVTVHHCLFAHNNDRNPLINSGSRDGGEPAIVDFRNNVMYNQDRWPRASVAGSKWVNYVGNTVIVAGPKTPESPNPTRPFLADGAANQRIFLRDCVWPGRPEGLAVDGAEPAPAPPVATQPAAEAREAVLRFAGATLPVRDVVDARVVEEVRTGTGALVNTQAEVGGWPAYRSSEPPADGDHDGMPDEWERRCGLDSTSAADGPADRDGDGYTNVEEYLNGTDPTAGPPNPPEIGGAWGGRPDPVVQAGNEALRFGTARVAPKTVVYDPAERRAFADAVRASGREVADLIGIRFATIAPGVFTKIDNGAFGRLKERVRVVMTKPYEIATCEVTQGQWARVMGTHPWLGRELAADNPESAASYVSWDDAQEFVARLNACGERRYRLPSEAEWEWAAYHGRDGDSPFWFEPNQVGAFAWHSNNTIGAGEAYAHPVGRKQANPQGLFDVVGNVHEWCQDAGDYFFWRRGGEKTDPLNAPTVPGGYRVLRGGSFYYRPSQLLGFPGSTHRPGYCSFDVGFRVVRLPP